jgi:hypothetical protein
MAKRRPDFLRISRNLFFCVGAVASKERSGAVVDALIEAGALEGKKRTFVAECSSYRDSLKIGAS